MSRPVAYSLNSLMSLTKEMSMLRGMGGGKTAFSPSSLPGLISWWKLEEASGQRSDSFGTNHLTDNNTVTQAAGKVGNAAQFTAANSEYLNIADNAALSVGDIDFTIACGAYLDSVGSDRAFFQKVGNPANDREYALGYQKQSDRFIIFVSNGGTVWDKSQTADTLGVPSLATWYWVVAWHDASANTLNIQVNNGTVDSVSYSSGVRDGTGPLNVGSYNNGAGAFMNGRVDEILFAKAVWTAAERTNLYNWWLAGGA